MTGAQSAGRPAVSAMFVLLLLAVTVLERLGLTFGAASVSAAQLVIYPVLLVAGLAGRLVLSLERALLFAVLMAVALASTIANEHRASFGSLALLAALYLPLLFRLRHGTLAENDADWIYSRFLDLCALLALIGVAQFGAQLFIHRTWVFDYASYLPPAVRVNGIFNTVIPIGNWNKSNGFFFREPSGFSFMMALGLITEWVTRRRLVRVLGLGLALLLTYSGTGILALFLALLHPFGTKTLLRVAALIAAFALVFGLFGDALNLSFTLGRVSELQSDGSSGYARYVAPARLLAETFGVSGIAAWLGHGPGTIFQQVRGYEYHDPTWAKLLFEYGVLGFSSCVLFFTRLVGHRGVPVQVRAALFWGWLVMGGHLLSPEQVFLTALLVGMLPEAGRLTLTRVAEDRRAPALRRMAWC